MKKSVSITTRKRLEIQGFEGYSDEELYKYKTGIRFAYLGCGTIVLLGFLFGNPVFYFIAMIIAFFGAVLPKHPLDYVYNSTVRKFFNYPIVPNRTSQGKFACGIATVWLAAIIYLMLNGMTLVYQAATILLLAQAFVVGTIDFCVPSKIFNALFRKSKITTR
jgi:hypothetical protein